MTKQISMCERIVNSVYIFTLIYNQNIHQSSVDIILFVEMFAC